MSKNSSSREKLFLELRCLNHTAIVTSEYTNEGHAERKLIFQYFSTNEHICDAVLWLHSGEKRKKQTRVKAEENKFSIQWRIQDFPTGGGGDPRGGR